MIEKRFDIPFIADLALREKQIQQNYRPVIAVHKWFARRPGTLFRGLLLSEFSHQPLQEAFYSSNNFSGIKVADPFMGGGTPLLEANRVGCDVIGFDINPMSYWIVHQEIEQINLKSYEDHIKLILEKLEEDTGVFYKTRCEICNNNEASVKYFLWVKEISCNCCGKNIDLFPGYLLSSDSRHPKNVFVCASCGKLTETCDKKNPGKCDYCGNAIRLDGTASRSNCLCPHCGTVNKFPNEKMGPPRHRLFAIEYHCPVCKKNHDGRFFKSPDDQDLALVAESEARWKRLEPQFVPDNRIPSGDETNRLHRWGYRFYKEMFNPRQLLSLELSARTISNISDERIRSALATNFSDLLRYQNMLCRYDTTALKSLDIFSVHGFPVGLIQCESNFLGIMDEDKKVCIGSGGWRNIAEKFRKAKSYCDTPFEVRHRGPRKEIVQIQDEWIGNYRPGENNVPPRTVELHCADSAVSELAASSLDAVFTDPPYFGNVQYAELMDFCYVWLRRLVGKQEKGFKNDSTRNPQELTGNTDMGRGLDHFTEGLAAVFCKISKALKPGAPLSFTYHHNTIDAYFPIAVAILDAGLVCSATLPCPGEMSASIHINGTESSIIDTVFVCRSTGVVSKRTLTDSAEGVSLLVREDLEKLQKGSVKPSRGDTRCIAHGHLIRLAVWNLRKSWNKNLSTTEKIGNIYRWIETIGGWPKVESYVRSPKDFFQRVSSSRLTQNHPESGDDNVDVSF